MQIEKTLLKLSNSDKISKSDIDEAKKTIQIIKRNLATGEFEKANELLRSLAALLNMTQN